MNKKIPFGLDSFNKIRRGNFYYVDKTNLIKDLIEFGGKVNLFTRPRRFGKSLNISMLKAFFEIGTDVSLFDGLEISKEKELCDKYLGKFPVISLNLKEVDGNSFDKALNMLKRVISKEANRFKWLMDSDKLDKYDKEELGRILSNNFESYADLCFSLELLTRLLYNYYGESAILLIDEYDVPMDKAYFNGFYSEMTDILRSLFSSVLKTNDCLEFAVITGCLRISKESIFTGLNNFKVRTVADTAYSMYFGFTDSEVKQMLEYYKLSFLYDTVKEWYDGYLFGKTGVYCPWDVINYT